MKGSDWLAKLAGDWEAAAAGCGEGVRRVVLRYKCHFFLLYAGLRSRSRSAPEVLEWGKVPKFLGPFEPEPKIKARLRLQLWAYCEEEPVPEQLRWSRNREF